MVVEAPTDEAAALAAMADGRVVGRVLPAVEVGGASPLKSVEPPLSAFHARPVRTIGLGVWMGMMLTGLSGFVLWLTVMLVMLLVAGTALSTCSGGGAGSRGSRPLQGK